MELLKKSFNEVRAAFGEVFSNYSKLKNLLTVVLLLSIFPTIVAVGLKSVEISNPRLSGSFAWLVSYQALVMFISFIFTIASASILIGFIAKKKEVIKEKKYSICNLAKDGIKKFLPTLSIGVYVILPFIASVAFISVFINTLGPLATIIGFIGILISAVWAVLVYFTQLSLIVDDIPVEKSLIRSISLVTKNIADLIVRFIVLIFSVALPTAIISSIINTIGLVLIKTQYHLPSAGWALEHINSGKLSLSGRWILTIIESIDTAFVTMIVLPVVIVYIYNLYETLKKETKTTPRTEEKIKRYVIWMYTFVLALSLSVLLKVIV